jgi:biopolymer transport protein ExbD
MVREVNSTNSRLVGLRTKYFPKNRIGHSLVSAAPWLDVIFLVICFVMLESSFVLQQGVVINLPTSSFVSTVSSDMILVVRSVDGGESGIKEIIFFDDERFLVDNENRMIDLKASFVEHVVRHKESAMLIYADRGVKQGTLVNIFNMVRDAGVVRVNIASRPEVDTE